MGEQYGGRRDGDVQALFRYLSSSIKSDEKLKLYFKATKSLSCEVIFKNRNDHVWLACAIVSDELISQKEKILSQKDLYFAKTEGAQMKTIENAFEEFSGELISLNSLAITIFGPLYKKERFHSYNSNREFSFYIPDLKELGLSALYSLFTAKQSSQFVRIKKMAVLYAKSIALEREDYSLEASFEEVLDIFRTDYPQYELVRSGEKHYAQIALDSAYPQSSLHYEFSRLKKDDSISCEFHIEKNVYEGLYSVLQDDVSFVVEDLEYDELILDPTWSDGKGRLRLVFIDWSKPKDIAETMHEFIVRSQPILLEHLNKKNPRKDQKEQPIIVAAEEMQIKGWYRLPGDGIQFLTEVLDTLSYPMSVEKLEECMRERSLFNHKTLASDHLRLLIKFGFLQIKDGKLKKDVMAEHFARGDYDLLIRAFLQRVFLTGTILRWLVEESKSDATSLKVFQKKIKEEYPLWTTNAQPDVRIWWMRLLGLATPAVSENLYGNNLKVTELGVTYASLLQFPKKESKVLSSMPEVPFHTILQVMKEANENLILNEEQLLYMHSALHASDKRFLLLSGLSGTGKTALLSLYAECYLSALDLDSTENYKIVAVTPAFRDPTPLLGYLNTLQENSRYIPGEITQFLLHAQANPYEPHFLILDEMNLARVEFYLAPILSAMESKKGISFHEFLTPVSGVPNELEEWPSNIFIGGTVNMDETTHAFSDKVLDRAFTLEFWDIDLDKYFQKHSTYVKVQTVIEEMYTALKVAKTHFGYRTVKGIVDYVNVGLKSSKETGEEQQEKLLDIAIFSKVLPKIRGQQSEELEQSLASVLAVCEKHNLRQCVAKIQQMNRRLQNSGLTRFWT